jgi:hypothetical protein
MLVGWIQKLLLTAYHFDQTGIDPKPKFRVGKYFLRDVQGVS